MRVIQAQIQTVEGIYDLVWSAVANRRPLEATYQTAYRGMPAFWRDVLEGRSQVA